MWPARRTGGFFSEIIIDPILAAARVGHLALPARQWHTAKPCYRGTLLWPRGVTLIGGYTPTAM